MNPTLREVDPCRDLVIDPTSEQAQAMVHAIVAQERALDTRSRRRSAPARPRLVTAMAALGTVAAGLVIIVANRSSSAHQDVALGPDGYRVERQPDGAVQVAVRWTSVRDPHALQVALDRAGARVKVRVVPAADETMWCQTDVQLFEGPLAKGVVDYHLPGANDGLLIRPQKFPAGVTLLLTVQLSTSGSQPAGTAAPSEMAGYETVWAIGPVADCS